MSAFKFLTGCCKSIESVVEQPVQDALKRPITNESIICMIDQIEGKTIESVADTVKPVINGVVQPIIGIDVSGNIDTLVKTVIEPAVQIATNEKIVSIEKQVLEHMEAEVEKVRIPVLHENL
jgi:hypothetical protein